MLILHASLIATGYVRSAHPDGSFSQYRDAARIDSERSTPILYKVTGLDQFIMSFNKDKAMRNAERYLTQGKIQAAIGEYRQIADQDPKDINTHNMLGDLYTKAGNDVEAIKCYQIVAEYYNGQGFAKKAIAIYNKIYRIEPNSLEVSSKLADLYRMRGSYAEAKKHYESLAAHYESKGQRVEALAMWESIAEIDPRNAEIYLKIAESYWHDGRESDASDSFIKAAKRLADAGNHESAVTAFSRALEISPVEFAAIEGLVRSQINLGYPEEAAKALEARIENDPYDKPTNFLLVDCYYEMDDAASAERIIVKMVERDPSNYRQFYKLIEVYFKSDDLESAVRVMSMIAEHMLVGGEHEALHGLIEEVLARNPEHIGALRLLARHHAWLKDEGELKLALERVAESARLNNLEEDERYALSQLSILAPHETGILARLEELGAGSGDFESSPHFQVNQTGEVPNFESYAVLSDTRDGNGSTENNAEDQGAGKVGENGFAFESFSGDVSATSSPGSNEETLEAELVSEESEAGVSGEFAKGSVESNMAEPNSYVQEDNEARSDKSSHIESAQDGAASENQEEQTGLSAGDEMKLEEELESIRFYLEQGYHGLADKSLTELELAFGARPELVELRAMLKGTEFESSSAVREDHAAPVGQESKEAATNAESTAVSEQGANSDESKETDSFTLQVDVSSDNADEIPRTNTSEKEVVHEVASKEASEEFVPEASETSALESGGEVDDVPGSVLSNSFESLRDELGFSETDGDEQDDYENHYHHAVAYQEMGLTENAIREFQDAVNAVSPDDGTRRYLNCCTLLGHCFMEMGMPNLGVGWFEKAFASKDLSSEESNGIRYELASAHEAGGDLDQAIVEFEKIYTNDVDFRDVGARIESLASKVPTLA